MRNDPVFIDDGYTEAGYIAAVPGLHGALRFKFRPMTRMERMGNLSRLSKCRDDEQAEQKAVEFLAKRILEWDAGRPVTVAALKGLHPELLTRLAQVVNSFSPSDPDPESAEPPATDETREADAKN